MINKKIIKILNFDECIHFIKFLNNKTLKWRNNTRKI